jgi:hypothetical protein
MREMRRERETAIGSAEQKENGWEDFHLVFELVKCETVVRLSWL